ncbi:MAG: hypothetical protein ABI670_15695 [Chloroflexota bacterium]
MTTAGPIKFAGYYSFAGAELSEIAAKLVHLVAWHGKMFDPVKGELCNELLPFRIQGITAKVYKDESRFDGNECIARDHSDTSLIAHWIRDESASSRPASTWA